MKLKHLTVPTSASTGVIFTQSMTSAQDFSLGGSGTYSDVACTYLDYAGAFGGNDKGAQEPELDNFNTLFVAGWSFSGDNEDGTVSFFAGEDGTQSGSASTSLSSFGGNRSEVRQFLFALYPSRLSNL